MKTRKINPDDMHTLAVILAANGDVPRGVGGWRGAGDGHHVYGPLGLVGQLGQIACYGDRHYVCDRASTPDDPRVNLPNSHPDYISMRRAHWTLIPLPDECDWKYIPTRYHVSVGQCRVDADITAPA